MPDTEKEKIIELRSREDLPVVFIDQLQVTPRNDGIYYISLFSLLPGPILNEQFRMMVPKESMNRMLEVLCNHCNYFPLKKDTAEGKKKAK